MKIFTLFELSTSIHELNHSFTFNVLKPLLKCCILRLLVSSEPDALPSHGGETQVRVSQSQVAELGLGSMLPASNSRKG